MAASFKDYPTFFKSCFENVKPGGYLEMQGLEFTFASDDGTVPPTSAIAKWRDLLVEAFEKMERPVNMVNSYRKLMEEAGFVDIVEVVHKWPMSTWPKDPEYKDLGAWQLANLLQGIQGFCMAPFTRALGWGIYALLSSKVLMNLKCAIPTLVP